MAFINFAIFMQLNTALQQSRIQELRQAIHNISLENEHIFQKLEEYEHFRNDCLDQIDLFYNPTSLFSSDSDYYSSDDELIEEPSDSDSAEFCTSKTSKKKAKTRSNLVTEPIPPKPAKSKPPSKPVLPNLSGPTQKLTIPPFSPLQILTFYKYNMDPKKLYSDYLETFKESTDKKPLFPFSEREFIDILANSPIMHSIVNKVLRKAITDDQIGEEIKKFQVAMFNLQPKESQNPQFSTLQTIYQNVKNSKPETQKISSITRMPMPAINLQPNTSNSTAKLRAELEAKLSSYSTEQLYEYILHLDTRTLVAVLLKLPSDYRNALLPKLTKEQSLAYEAQLTKQDTANHAQPVLPKKEIEPNQQQNQPDNQEKYLRYLAGLSQQGWDTLKARLEPTDYANLVMAVNLYKQQSQ